MDEQPLICAARHGNERAFAQVVEPLLPHMFRSAYLILLDAALAQDAVQEALVRAYLHLRSFRQGQPFRPWLQRFVVNEALKAGRSRGRRPIPVAGLPDLPAPADDSPELALITKEERQRVWAALQALDAAHRTVLVLRYYQQLTEAEMSNVLDVAPGTIKSRLHRARHLLQTKLAPPPEPAPSKRWLRLWGPTER